MIDHGVKEDGCNGKYGNALKAAAYEELEDIVELLLNKGSDIDLQVEYNKSPLRAAVFGRNLEIVELLLK
jgi:ankyrin repeat protein